MGGGPITSAAWEKRGDRTYFYRTIRSEGRVRKLYYGTGPVGQLAAEVDALGRTERKAEKETLRAARVRLDAAMFMTQQLSRVCELLAAASLLTAGFHRPARHAWRRWRHGRKALGNTH
jgi:hypothetical protein